MPSPARACAGSAIRSRPSKSMRPLVGLRWPMRLLMSVVLPAPLRPTRPTMRPLPTASVRPRSATTESMATWSDSTCSMGWLFHLEHQFAGDVAAHVMVGEDGGGQAVGDDPAGIERDHPARVALDDVHVVLDEEESHRVAAERGHDGVHHAEFLLGRDAARRLVEHEQARRAGERHRDVEELPHAARQLGDAASAMLAEAKALEQRVGARDRLWPARRLPEAQAAVVAGDSDEHVVEHRELTVELRDLERARDAEARDGARRECGDVAAVERDPAGIGLEVAGDHVDEGRLAGAVAADKTDAFAGGDADRKLGRGDDRAEAFGDARRLQQRHAHDPLRFDQSEPMPRGRKRITNSRKRPSASCQVLGKYALENDRTTSSTVLATNTAATLC